MFHAESEDEKDRLFQGLQKCVKKVDPNVEVFCQKACANLYYDLLGDWKEWKEVAKIRNPEIRLVLLEKIKKLLYWEKS